MQKNVTISIPGAARGQKKQITLDRNPLYSYKFTSPYADEQVQTVMNWKKVSTKFFVGDYAIVTNAYIPMLGKNQSDAQIPKEKAKWT
jgi:hypothetical protein